MAGYTATIRDTRTGEVRDYFMDLEWYPHSDWHWTEGNFGCDCNRSLFFARAINTPEDQIDEAPCGEMRYQVRIVIGGEAVVDEID